MRGLRRSMPARRTALAVAALAVVFVARPDADAGDCRGENRLDLQDDAGPRSLRRPTHFMQSIIKFTVNSASRTRDGADGVTLT